MPKHAKTDHQGECSWASGTGRDHEGGLEGNPIDDIWPYRECHSGFRQGWFLPKTIAQPCYYVIVSTTHIIITLYYNIYIYSIYKVIIHPASRGVAAHTAGLFRSVRGAKGGFPPWGLPKLRILTSPPVGAPQAREFSLFPPVGSPQAREFSLFPPPWGLPKLGNFHFPRRGGSPS